MGLYRADMIVLIDVDQLAKNVVEELLKLSQNYARNAEMDHISSKHLKEAASMLGIARFLPEFYQQRQSTSQCGTALTSDID